MGYRKSETQKRNKQYLKVLFILSIYENFNLKILSSAKKNKYFESPLELLPAEADSSVRVAAALISYADLEDMTELVLQTIAVQSENIAKK